MTPERSQLPPQDDDRLFDLLADGQLDEPRRRELLSGLDERPGGWRRCAMAFLEAQSWREAMDAFTHLRPAAEIGPAQPAAVAAVAPSSKRRKGDYLTTMLGMAASFLLAIGLTSLMRDMQGKGVSFGPGVGLADITAGDFAPGGQAPSATKIPICNVASNPNVQLVNLTSRGPDGHLHTVGMPAVARDKLDEQWLRDMPTAVPKDLIQSLQKTGYEVRPSRQLLPVRMQDGRRLVIPVDQIDVREGSESGYQ